MFYATMILVTSQVMENETKRIKSFGYSGK